MSLRITVIAIGMLVASAAEGVTSVAMIKNADQVDAVTTGAAVRAQADMQIRRLKTMIITKSLQDVDAARDRLEKLQFQLRGEK